MIFRVSFTGTLSKSLVAFPHNHHRKNSLAREATGKVQSMKADLGGNILPLGNVLPVKEDHSTYEFQWMLDKLDVM